MYSQCPLKGLSPQPPFYMQATLIQRGLHCFEDCNDKRLAPYGEHRDAARAGAATGRGTCLLRRAWRVGGRDPGAGPWWQYRHTSRRAFNPGHDTGGPRAVMAAYLARVRHEAAVGGGFRGDISAGALFS